MKKFVVPSISIINFFERDEVICTSGSPEEKFTKIDFLSEGGVPDETH